MEPDVNTTEMSRWEKVKGKIEEHKIKILIGVVIVSIVIIFIIVVLAITGKFSDTTTGTTTGTTTSTNTGTTTGTTTSTNTGTTTSTNTGTTTSTNTGTNTGTTTNTNTSNTADYVPPGSTDVAMRDTTGSVHNLTFTISRSANGEFAYAVYPGWARVLEFPKDVGDPSGRTYKTIYPNTFTALWLHFGANDVIYRSGVNTIVDYNTMDPNAGGDFLVLKKI